MSNNDDSRRVQPAEDEQQMLVISAQLCLIQGGQCFIYLYSEVNASVASICDLV